MTIRAVTKAKRSPKRIVCPSCICEMKPHVVTVKNLRGPDSQGIEVRHVECAPCGSTGYVNRKPTGCPCCNGPKADRCPHCAVAGRNGQEVHWCERQTVDELAFETELQFAPSPRAGAKTTAAAQALGNGVGERSGQRGNR